MAEELAEEEEFPEESSIEEFKLILEGFPFCAALVDEDHRVVYANEGLRSTLGNAFDDLLSRHGETQNAVESSRSSCPVCKSIEKGHSAVSLELRSDEGNATLNIALFPLNIRTERGRRLFLCIGWGISKEHAGNGLHQTADTGDEKYRAVFQNTPNMVGILTCEGVFVDANPVMLECFGQDIVGRNIAEVTPEDCLPLERAQPGRAGDTRDDLLELKPDIVLMDILMPEMDGITATKAIKEIDRNAKILAITAYASSKGKEMLEVGALDVIEKPIRKIQLIAKIEEYLE
ncbi:response regulator [Geoglobus sp.]